MQSGFAARAHLDKERRFINAMASTQQRLKLTHSTIFAWHGSPMQNRHSIIREGLHFRDTINGLQSRKWCLPFSRLPTLALIFWSLLTLTTS